MLEAWVNAEVPVAMTVGDDKKMVPPVMMASTTWGSATGNNAPICSIDTPATDATISEGESISYTGTAVDSDGTIASYAWSFPGGSPASSTAEDPGSVVYSAAGVYTTTFTATDDATASCQAATVQVTVNAVGGGLQAGVQDPPVTGVITGKGKNQTFSETSAFAQGDSVIIRSTVVDSNGGGVANATVTTNITGPESATITSGPSDANGIAESTWNTSAPNRRGQGGTPTGSYTATTANVEAAGFDWDGVTTNIGFTVE